jgi:hypothetical protein
VDSLSQHQYSFVLIYNKIEIYTKYGSILRKLTEYPNYFISNPILLFVTPLPIPDAIAPQIKTYLQRLLFSYCNIYFIYIQQKIKKI